MYARREKNIGPPPLSHHYSMDGKQCQEMKTERQVQEECRAQPRALRGHTQGSLWAAVHEGH